MEIEQLLTPGIAASHLSGGKWVMAEHLAYIDEVITRAILDESEPRLIVIEAPPRHGKSEYTSKWLPAWNSCVFPDRRVILTSYEATFARKWGREAKAIVEEHGHHFGVSIDRNHSAANDWGIAGRSGGMNTSGIGGPLTGRGADLLIVDDPIKNAEESLSQTVRDSHWDWWQSTASTRIEPGGLAIVMATRWHDDDLSGRLLRAADSGDGIELTHIHLPAIAEKFDQLGRAEGDALWPERWPIEHLRTMEKSRDAYWWNSLYQQSPGRHGSMEWPAEYFGDWLWCESA